MKPDPWRPDHGAGAEAPFEDTATEVVVDPSVEMQEWDQPITPGPAPPEPVTFVDGVMRVDLRVLARDGDRRAWGLLGSYAAGGVRCDGAAGFVGGDEPVGRALVLGGRITGPPVDVTAGSCRMSFETRSILDDSPHAQRTALQRLMLKAEQRMALKLAAGGLVLADGPLHLNGGSDAEIVGVVKRMVTAYLEGAPAELITTLVPGQRSPLFALVSSVLDRFAWYQRLVPRDDSWHELSGLVRCEVRMEVGLEAARSIADRVAGLLPAFAGRPGIDPRAPQNLTPVGALEAHLRHRLGHSTVVRRALQAKLAEAPDG